MDKRIWDIDRQIQADWVKTEQVSESRKVKEETNDCTDKRAGCQTDRQTDRYEETRTDDYRTERTVDLMSEVIGGKRKTKRQGGRQSSKIYPQLRAFILLVACMRRYKSSCRSVRRSVCSSHFTFLRF